MERVRWGVLGTAKIAREKVIPAMQRGRHCEVAAIASRDLNRARECADSLGIDKAFGSYEELLADPGIDAVYIPLPNHLHVPWSINALDAGKHVLCEKPIGLNAAEAVRLQEKAAQHPELKVMEAFMYRFHPQWLEARIFVQEGRLGELEAIHTWFCYHNTDPGNIRNKKEWGGGGLMDIGCYAISLSRFLFGREPRRVAGALHFDPITGVDRLASGTLDFETGTSTFTCATQLQPYQRVLMFGTEGSLEIELPFNAPNDRPCRAWLEKDGKGQGLEFPVADQYTLQGDVFSECVLADKPLPTPLEDAVANMRAIDALRESAGAAS